MSSAMPRDEVLASVRRACADGRRPAMADLAAAAGVAVRTLYRLFGSRAALLREAGCAPEPDAQRRILDAALEQLGERGLAELSMDEVAASAGVSRATVYRSFPGKSALFSELIRTFSPWEPVADVLDALPDGRPDDVIPSVAQAIAETLDGRTGLLLRMVAELLRGDRDTADGLAHSMGRGLPDLVAYLDTQTHAGNLRPMDPVLAVQLLAGPIVTHLLTRPLAAPFTSDRPRPEPIGEIAHAWLRAMSPESHPSAG